MPAHLAEQGFDVKVCERLGLEPRESRMEGWYRFTSAMHAANERADVTRIRVVGKYTQLPDAYLSVIEALHHSGVLFGRHVDIRLVDGEALDEKNVEAELGDADGILVPGASACAASRARSAPCAARARRACPYLGVCLGLQVAVCEFARDVCGLAGASSKEFDPETPHP